MATLFTDGFESGDFTAWSSYASHADLTVHVDAKNSGVYGMKLVVDDAAQKIVNDSTPSNIKRYRMRFYLNTNSISMANNDEFIIFQAFDSSWLTDYLLKLKYTTASGYEIVGVDRTDDAWSAVVTELISDGWHAIEVDWKASSGPGNNDGFFRLYVDGVLESSADNIDTDTEAVDRIVLGLVSEYDGGTSGTLYFDDFECNDDGTEIEAISDTVVKDIIGAGIIPFPR